MYSIRKVLSFAYKMNTLNVYYVLVGTLATMSCTYARATCVKYNVRSFGKTVWSLVHVFSEEQLVFLGIMLSTHLQLITNHGPNLLKCDNYDKILTTKKLTN